MFDKTLILAGVIQSVKPDCDCFCTEIYFVFEKYSFTLFAAGDSHSLSIFETVEEQSYQELVGKKVIYCDCEDIYDGGKYDWIRIYRLTLDDNSSFSFQYAHDYENRYCGWTEVNDFLESTDLEPYVKNKTAKAVILVGLNSSGKSYQIKDHFNFDSTFKSEESWYFDHLTKYEMRKVLNCGHNIILSNTYLYEIRSFQLYYNMLLEHIESPSQITIYLFEKNPTQCGNNLRLYTNGEKFNRIYTEDYLAKNSEDYSKTILFIENELKDVNIVYLPVHKN